MTEAQKRVMKRSWSKDQIIHHLEMANEQISELNTKLEERDGTVFRLGEERDRLVSELRETRHKAEFHERVLKRLVGMS